MIRLKSITAEDIDFLRQVYASSRTEEMQLTGWDATQISEFISMQFNAQHQHYIKYYPNAKMDVIYVDARPAGRLYVERTSKEIRLMDICLLPEFRKSGIGTYLMQRLIDDAKKDDLLISLHVEKNNSSKEFYDRLGFQVIEDRQTHWFMEYQPNRHDI